MKERFLKENVLARTHLLSKFICFQKSVTP